MSTRSLRTRLSVTTLAFVAAVLAVVIAAVTLAYRARLYDDLRGRVTHAAAVVAHAGSAPALKPLIPGLTLEGIAVRFTAPPGTGARKTSSTLRTQGSLLTLTETLRDRSTIVFSSSNAAIGDEVTNLLLVEVLVAIAALALGAILIARVTQTAIRPLSVIIETAARIAEGDSKLRLSPSRTDTDLGRLASTIDRMLDALDSAIEEARANDSATRRFLADASHELRTPIAALQASTETLLREQPDRPERDRLEAAVARDSARLGRLVDDLLGLARLEAHPQMVPVDLTAIAGALLDDARSRAPSTAITLTMNGDGNVIGDPNALERVLRNLIENSLSAIQPIGHLELTLTRSGDVIDVVVRDDGPGVPNHEVKRIFERFVRLDPGKAGHGLGLAIARRIARQHGGDLVCEPSQNGAVFRLQIPAAKTATGGQFLSP